MKTPDKLLSTTEFVLWVIAGNADIESAMDAVGLYENYAELMKTVLENGL